MSKCRWISAKGLNLQVITILKKLWMIRLNTRDNTKQQSLLTNIREMLLAKRLLKIRLLKDWRRNRSWRQLEMALNIRRKRSVNRFKKVHTLIRLNDSVRPLDQRTVLPHQGLKSAMAKTCGVHETRLYHLQLFLKKVLTKISKTARNIGTWRQPWLQRAQLLRKWVKPRTWIKLRLKNHRWEKTSFRPWTRQKFKIRIFKDRRTKFETLGGLLTLETLPLREQEPQA